MSERGWVVILMDETHSELLHVAEASEYLSRLAMIALYLLDDPAYTKDDAVRDIRKVMSMIQVAMPDFEI